MLFRMSFRASTLTPPVGESLASDGWVRSATSSWVRIGGFAGAGSLWLA